MWAVDTRAPDAITVRFPDVRAGWSCDLLALSCTHLGSVDTDTNAIRSFLDQAVERGAGIFIIGDVVDAMGFKTDPRNDPGKTTPDLQRSDYFDRVVDYAVRFLAPYSKSLLFIGRGNHEESVERHHGTDLITRIVERLNRDHGGNIAAGGYAGFVRLMFNIQKTATQQIRMYYTHGRGGNAPVTHGVISANRNGVSVAADIYVSGHVHKSWEVDTPVTYLNEAGGIDVRPVLHVSLPSSKVEGSIGRGFAVERGFHRVIPGARWIHLRYDRERIKYSSERLY